MENLLGALFLLFMWYLINRVTARRRRNKEKQQMDSEFMDLMKRKNRDKLPDSYRLHKDVNGNVRYDRDNRFD